MKKTLLYLLLIIATISAIICAVNKVEQPLYFCILIWIIVIIVKINKEKKNRFKDREMQKYKYNATRKKEQKEHYNEYKSERKLNKDSK